MFEARKASLGLVNFVGIVSDKATAIALQCLLNNGPKTIIDEPESVSIRAKATPPAAESRKWIELTEKSAFFPQVHILKKNWDDMNLLAPIPFLGRWKLNVHDVGGREKLSANQWYEDVHRLKCVFYFLVPSISRL